MRISSFIVKIHYFLHSLLLAVTSPCHQHNAKFDGKQTCESVQKTVYSCFFPSLFLSSALRVQNQLFQIDPPHIYRNSNPCLSSLCLKYSPEEVLKDWLLMTALSAAHPWGFHSVDMHLRELHVGLYLVVRWPQLLATAVGSDGQARGGGPCAQYTNDPLPIQYTKQSEEENTTSCFQSYWYLQLPIAKNKCSSWIWLILLGTVLNWQVWKGPQLL